MIPLDSLCLFGISGYLVTVSHFWLFMVLWHSWGLVLSGPFDRRKPQLSWFVTKLLNRSLSPGAGSELCSRGSRRPWLWSGLCRAGCWAPGIFGSLRFLCNSQLCPVTEGAGVLGSVWFSVAVPLSSRTKLGVCYTEAAIVFRTIPLGPPPPQPGPPCWYTWAILGGTVCSIRSCSGTLCGMNGRKAENVMGAACLQGWDVPLGLRAPEDVAEEGGHLRGMSHPGLLHNEQTKIEGKSATWGFCGVSVGNQMPGCWKTAKQG